MPSPVSPEWLSPKALAGRWCLVRSTAYDLIARGHLPFYQLGGSIRVKWADVWANKEAGYQYSPQLGEAFHRRKRAVWISWRMDKTYIWVKVQWRYLYRAVDKHGQTIDFLLTEQRDERTATRFLTKAIRRHGVPETITINGSEANAAAIKRYNEEHRTAIIIRQVKYLNNMVEQNHRSVKRITRPELGFNSFAAVQDTMVGIELMCIIEQRQMVVEKGGKVSLQLNSSTPWLPNHLTVRVTSSQITYARKFETKPLRVMTRPILGGLHHGYGFEERTA